MNAESLRATVRAALEASDADAAVEALVSCESTWCEQREVALLVLEVSHAVTDWAGGEARADALARAFDSDPVVLAMCARVLVGLADRRPRDEPPLSAEGPETKAERLVARALPLADPGDGELRRWLRSLRANALRLAPVARDAEAVAAFEEALAEFRDDGNLWFDLGLLHKWRGRFKAGFDANLRAQARLGDTRPVLFNLGICATAIGDGNVAGLCWKKLGFEPSLNEKSGHAFVPDLPPMQVRVLSRGSGYGFGGAVPDSAVSFEVVWVEPLSPVHGVVVTPTFRDAPIDYGDVVLWDGAPVAVVQGPDGARVPRFPLLEILRRGDELRLRFVALSQREGDLEAVSEALPEGCTLVVQEERVEHLCSLCAAGDSMRKHDHLEREEHRIAYGKLVAPGEVKPPALAASLDAALRAGRVRLAIPGLYELLGDAKRAGQEHQAFRGIEQAAIKKGLVS